MFGRFIIHKILFEINLEDKYWISCNNILTKTLMFYKLKLLIQLENKVKIYITHKKIQINIDSRRFLNKWRVFYFKLKNDI
jgi:hypothetical protein